MKKRILFVDDEPNILKGLERSLRPMRSDWDMVFAQGGDNALNFLEKHPFDVIVSDMRMPRMDGDMLLNIVKHQYPMTARIILSGHSDKEMILKSMKSAHQYLSKPCRKEQLISAINKVCALGDLLNNSAVKQLLGKIETLPSMPCLYHQIMTHLQSSNGSAAGVGKIIGKDMGMTAKILQLVNAPFFGMSRHISGPEEAVVILGIDVVKTLVLSIEVFSTLSEGAVSVVSVDKIQDHCLKTGMIATKIGAREKMDKKTLDHALVASLLHDMGKLLLAEHFTDEYKTVIALVHREHLSFFKAEHQVFGITHAEVGAYLLGLWGLPQEIVHAIAFHHHPSKGGFEKFELCGLVHVAQLIEHHEQRQPGKWETLKGLDEAYLETLGMTGRITLWRDLIQQG
jgi:putative nucleotidyltransferase with HDIG domain